MRIPDVIAIPLFSIPWILSATVLGWFILQRFPPSGIFVVETVADGKSPFFHPFLPSERVTPPGKQEDGWVGQRMIGDPVYGSARVPGPYEKVHVELEFRPIRQPLIEFGIARDPEGKDLELQPLFFEGLQDPGWLHVENGFVRNGISGVRLRDPNPTGLAVWNASTTMPLLSDEVRSPKSEDRRLDVSLRGAHDFYLVPADGEIDLTLNLQDSNRKEGRTVAAFRIFRGNEEIDRRAIETNTRQETRMGKVFDYRIHLTDVEPGVYRIQFQADDDVFIRAIETTSKHWVLGPRLNFGDVVGYATSSFPGEAWTNSRHIVAETFHKEGLQTIQLGSDRVELRRTHDVFRIDRVDSEQEAQRLFSPQGDVRIVGDGWFAIKKETFFIPKPSRITDGTSLIKEGIVGVVTSYTRPEDLGDGWYRGSFSFSLQGYEDRLRFVLSAPGVLSRTGAVDVVGKFTFAPSPIYQTVTTYASWSYIFFL